MPRRVVAARSRDCVALSRVRRETYVRSWCHREDLGEAGRLDHEPDDRSRIAYQERTSRPIDPQQKRNTRTVHETDFGKVDDHRTAFDERGQRVLEILHGGDINV